MTRSPHAQSREARSVRTRRLVSLLGGGVISLVLLGLVFILPGAFGSERSPEPTAYPAVGEHNGQELAVVAYDRSGGGMPFQPMFQTRLTALDLANGEVIWDVRLNEEHSTDNRVLAAENGLSYVATEEGLYIRSLDDGSPVAGPDAIEGIGDAYVAEMTSYDYDPELRVVVAIDTTGTIHAIPVGESVAVKADTETVNRWLPVLGDTRTSSDFPTTSLDAKNSDGGSLSFEPTAQGAQTMSLTLTRGGNAGTDNPGQRIGDAIFFDPRFVIEGPVTVEPLTYETIADQCFFEDRFCEFDTLDPEQLEAKRQSGAIPLSPMTATQAAGSETGHALILHRTSANENDYVLSNVSLQNGKVIDTVETGYEIGGGVSIGGSTALTTYETSEQAFLIVASPEGDLNAFEIGRTNFLGMPW